MTIHEQLVAAKKAWPELAAASTETKNRALLAMADALIEDRELILEANAKDVEAQKGVIGEVMLDRLTLNEARIQGMAEGIRQVAELPDPVGQVLEETKRADGLLIRKISVALGVVAIIYESRPNVTSDAAALAIKSGNACVLRGGKEAYRSAAAITRAMRKGLAAAGLPEELVSLVEDLTHEGARELMTAVGLVDLLIPRGGAGLINACVSQAKVPCIQTGTGICHIFVDAFADFDKAVDIVENAKTSRPSVCNAEEVLLVTDRVAEHFLPMLYKRLVEDRKAKGLQPVEFRLDEQAAKIIPGVPAGEKDFDTEFLDYILAVKLVHSCGEAVDHIAAHSTGHSDAIVSTNQAHIDYFIQRVDSAAVYVNASTRFTDGGEFGLGCEMGISTQKLHARGPMGLRELNTYKYIVIGDGHIR